MKKLCLFTNEFPYGNWEPYLETEIEYYDNFEEIYIFSLQLRREHAKSVRKMSDKYKVVPVYYVARWKYLLNAFRVLKDKNLYVEIRRLKNRKMLNIKRLIDLFVFFSRADYEMRMIAKSVSKEEIEDAIFYSYRFEYQPYVALLLKKHLGLDNKIVARAHRYDLYEDRRPNKYIPCREILLENIEAVFPCSQQGTDYLGEKYPRYSKKISTKFLGTKDYGSLEYRRTNEWRIVSCSNLVPVKRIELIIKSLMNMTDTKIVWTHFGDGELREELEKLSKGVPNNIQIVFRGHISNEELMRSYKNELFDLFLNVSSSEGIPVSIMEAMSFGIPCIATDVGGTREIVENRLNGFLLEEKFEVEQLTNLIYRFINMPDREYLKFREEARKSWEKKYDADKNYLEFSRLLSVEL